MPKKALCVFTTLLGNKATAEKIIEAIRRVDGLDTTVVTVGLEDYSQYPTPRWARLSGAWEGQFLAKQKARPFLKESYDLLLVSGWEFMVAFRDLARRMPAAALIDSVPATFHHQLRTEGHGGWRRTLAHTIHHQSFVRAARHFQLYLPMGSDCAAALRDSCGAKPENCFVTLAPQDTAVWRPPTRTYSPPLRLLFVGNDFVRKGGDFLLRLYSEHLYPDFVLTIASDDPGLASRQLPRGVEWLQGRNRDQLRETYRSSDVFLFPTRRDFLPQVLAEALTMGLPCLANDVGGIRDLVQNGETGYLMHRDDPPERWAELLRQLAANPAAVTRMSANGRRFAEERLDVKRFQIMIQDVVSLLLGERAPQRRASSAS